MLLSAMHVGDPDSFSMDDLISSKHVIEFPLDTFGTKSSPTVMPFGQMMHGLSIPVKERTAYNPIASTIATNTSPTANVFLLMFLHLLTEVVLGSELKSESSALP
jgi:hypothetical protein